MQSLFNDPQYWRERADEARAMASYANDSEVISSMLRVAAEYDKIVSRLIDLRMVKSKPTTTHPKTGH